ncbi:MAG: hypothetical protein EBZ43_08080 [Betaproteobacteria bacterium]|nr:hypothetical protein [Betaproteobacteria bacterium]
MAALTACATALPKPLPPASSAYTPRAEVFWLQGALAASIEQLKLAQSAKDADFYHASTIDARLREAMQRWRSERAAMGPQSGRDTKP